MCSGLSWHTHLATCQELPGLLIMQGPGQVQETACCGRAVSQGQAEGAAVCLCASLPRLAPPVWACFPLCLCLRRQEDMTFFSYCFKTILFRVYGLVGWAPATCEASILSRY